MCRETRLWICTLSGQQLWHLWALCSSCISAAPAGFARLPATLGAPSHLHKDVEVPPGLQTHD